MGILGRVATVLGGDNRLVRWARPAREAALDLAYGRAGLPRVVNGVPVRVLPRYRAAFPVDHDHAVVAYFRERVRPGQVCLSVGANLGVYALQFAHWVGPAGRVYAFEPNPETAAVLRRHVELNAMADRVTVVEAAVGDKPGTATFYAAGVEGTSRLDRPNPLAAAVFQEVTVRVETLDEFCGREGVVPDHVMMDVEGYEAAVLAGGRRLFASATPPTTVAEMHPTAWPDAGTDREAIGRLLADLGLRPVPLAGQSDPLGEHSHVALVRG